MSTYYWQGNGTSRAASKRRHIGKLLSRRRKTLGLTVVHVAKFCNVTRGRVYQWEQERSVLAKNLLSLSRVLKIALGTLVQENSRRARSAKKRRMYKIEHLD